MIGQPSNRFVQQKKEKDKVFLLFLYPDPVQGIEIIGK